jgi:hypothetical protein
MVIVGGIYRVLSHFKKLLNPHQHLEEGLARFIRVDLEVVKDAFQSAAAFCLDYDV